MVLLAGVRLKKLFTKVAIQNLLFQSASLRNLGIGGRLMHGVPARRTNSGALKPDVKRNTRSFAFIACLAIFADPLGALGPTGALAQTAETVDGSRAKKTQKRQIKHANVHPASRQCAS